MKSCDRRRLNRRRHPHLFREIEHVDLHARGALESIVSAQQNGFSQNTGETSEWWDTYRGRMVSLVRVERYEGRALERVLEDIERQTYKIVTDFYTTILYSHAVDDLWTQVRSGVEAKLVELNLSEHLATIAPGINSDNAATRRSAALACRNLLADVATYLWQDTRTTTSI